MTLHKMVEKVDAGPIALQKEVLIDRKDTAVTLREKLNNAGNGHRPVHSRSW